MSQEKKISKFIQKVPIQSYLIAIAVGEVESRKIGPRTHVWSEREFVEKAAFDFAETESFLKTAEELCGPYVWGNYDILVLPPSFAYGDILKYFSLNSQNDILYCRWHGKPLHDFRYSNIA